MDAEQRPCCAPQRDSPAHTRVTADARDMVFADGSAATTPVADRPQLVTLPGGTFLMGSDDPQAFPGDGEGPVRPVAVAPFRIGIHAVTNAEFSAFIQDTGYSTQAQRAGNSFVFGAFVSAAVARTVAHVVAQTPWWWLVEGADWAHPEGPDSSLEGRQHHPVVHVSWLDAVRYCEWAGGRLPTEAEWEYAARGGLVQKRYAWGNELRPGGVHMCNIWQGKFPDVNHGTDGYQGTAPVDAFAPNGYGLFNVCGNVWEWCSDWFSATHHLTGPRTNPRGPAHGTARVTRGGSYLCHKSYCNRYRVAARSSNTPDSSTGNIGFRLAANAPDG